MPGVAGRRFERRAAACVPDRLRGKKSGHEGQRTHIYPHPFRPSSVRGPGRRSGWGGGKESACVSRCGGAGWAGVRDPYLPLPFHLPQCSVLLVRWGVCTKNEHTWCRGWGDGGWRMCHFPLVDQRLARLDRWSRGWATCSAWVGYDERDMSRRFLTQFSTRMGWGKARDGSVRRSPVFGRVLDSLRPLLLREVKCQMPNGRLPPNGKVCRHTVDIL